MVECICNVYGSIIVVLYLNMKENSLGFLPSDTISHIQCLQSQCTRTSAADSGGGLSAKHNFASFSQGRIHIDKERMFQEKKSL